MFFDEYERFLSTSETAVDPLRLELRHQAIVRDNAELFEGARVLDIASHDGRWSFAAQRAGAAYTTGIEARPELIASAVQNFDYYGVDRDKYRFVEGDVIDVLTAPDHGIEADVVMCLGFLYHTIRYPELFVGIRTLRPTHLLIDTAVMRSKRQVVRISTEDITHESHATGGPLAVDGRMLVGRPSVPGLRFLLQSYGFDVVKMFDWAGLLADRPDAKSVSTYARGQRVTWLCAMR